ncbi:MAG: helix-turn-helix domain-containing protein [Salipiger thiooxidans]|uniref:helix-turn-helix domain-containing protein n=1 Tax=Salipiger thiooxidans TaxID=282683 RepID=UPI001CFBC099|nr:XRE family transcriptional regulator [Salipiger thiooxidans]
MAEQLGGDTLSAEALGMRLRVLRQKRQMTLDALAAQTDLDKSYISRVERGKKSPSLATLMRLSSALGVSVSELFGGSVGSEDIQVVRAGERVTVTPTGSGAPYLEALGIKSDKLSTFVLHPQEESQAVGHGSVHTGEECVYVLKGEVEVSFEGRSERLSAQDCVHFPGIVPHKIRRVGSAEAVVLVIVVNGDH